MDPNQRIEYLYKEYARLSEKLEESLKGCFEDFKLFGGASATILLWKPIADVVARASPKVDNRELLFLGFLTLLVILVLIGSMILNRMAYMFLMGNNLQSYEHKIRKELHEDAQSQVFRLNLEKDTAKFATAFRMTYGTGLIILSLAITFIPFTILSYTNIFHAVIYLLLALLAVVNHIRVVKKLAGLYSHQFKFF